MPTAAEVNAMSRVRSSLVLAILGLIAACGHSSSPAPAVVHPAVGLDYADPDADGWRLVRNPSSTVTHLVLDLIGPDGEKGRGVGFNLRSDGTVKFAKFASGSYINDLGVFQVTSKRAVLSLVSGKPVTNDVGAIVGGVKDGGRVLSVGAFQKDRRWPAQALDQPLYQIAIDFDPAQALAAGTVIPLTFVKARSIPENIGDNPDDSEANPVTWAYQYRIDDVQIAVGKLVAL